MAKPESHHSGGNSIFTGVLIGLIVGAALAVGVALWVSGSSPFKSATPASAPRQAAPAVPDAAPSFDFYKVLPSEVSAELPSTTAPTEPLPRYYLQAGAFQNANDADNLKAQLAMLGVEAAIQTADVADKGVFHRVRIGPFSTQREADPIRSLLSQNDIPATLVKEIPPTQEMP